ncbi:class I SAM-dependent methyltransferase [Mammaliicoccus sciuri]|uniref:class I SAM-dependent methyltransferase n=1 Tax=Mammaliicoccus sciuri TaxID=1296 RepID=UPI000D1DC4E2|nr:class I SAM-dependent methyltransferase [Mammaliicoccus sciuri]PTK00452.1 hypothetical protein BUZ87_12195 [Mammaliicoccus sciuri]
MSNLLNHLHSPEPFEKSEDNIWLDSLFSSFVLDSYFNSEIYGGSKDTDFINKTSIFFSENFPSDKYKKLLDLGCGPGLYAEAFAKKGYDVTGIDYSSTAINYAIKNAKNSKSNIHYFEDDILSFKSNKKFDICTIIYQTYATFSYKNRRKLVENVHNLLNENGVFIFDVPTQHYYDQLSPVNVWEYRNQNNIVSTEQHAVLYSLEKYYENIFLNKSIYIFENQKIKKFYDWMKCFNELDIKNEIGDFFNIERIYSDIDGTPFSKDSNSLTLICQKI